MTIPANDVATELDGAGISLTLGTNLFTGPFREVSPRVPKDSVFIKGLPGGLPERTMGQVDEIRSPLVSVQVRNTSFNGGDTKVRAIQETLTGVVIAGYLDIATQQSEPLYIGQDNEGLHLWSMIYSLKYIDITSVVSGIFSIDFSGDFL